MSTAPYPSRVVVARPVLETLFDVATTVSTTARTEWGGYLWGLVLDDPRHGPVPIVLAATDGICRATKTTCEILPQTWERDRKTLEACGLGALEQLGDWHSHPTFGVFLSDHHDRPAFWAGALALHWLSAVVDPWDTWAPVGVFAQVSPLALRRVPSFQVSRCALRALLANAPAVFAAWDTATAATQDEQRASRTGHTGPLPVPTFL
jgi:hypothetical protein